MLGDAHKAAGLWSIWFFVLMIATGVWYLAELGAGVGAQFGGQTFEPKRPTLSSERMESFGDVIAFRPTDDIISATNTLFPELSVTDIIFPFQSNQGITVLGKRNNPILRSRANRIFLDPVSLEPLKIQRSEEIGWVAWLNEAADPLHFGYFGGLITKIIWFIFGLAMTGLSASGVWLTWRRVKSKSVTRTQFATIPVLLISFAVGYFSWYPRYVNAPEPHSEEAMVTKRDGAISLTPYLGLKANGEADGTLRFLAHGIGGWPNLKKVSVSLDRISETTVKSPAKIVSWGNTTVIKDQMNARELTTAKSLTVEVELHSGRTFKLSWPLTI